MNKQYLLIYNYPALFSIFNELKEVLGFEVKNLSENDFKKKNYINDLVISKNNLNIDNQVKIDKFPIEFERLLDILNIHLYQIFCLKYLFCISFCLCFCAFRRH